MEKEGALTVSFHFIVQVVVHHFMAAVWVLAIKNVAFLGKREYCRLVSLFLLY